MNPIDVLVGTRLRDRRRATYLGMDEVAHAIGVDFATLQRLEAGAERASAEQIRVLCRVYAMSPADLYSRPASSARAGGGDPVPSADVC